MDRFDEIKERMLGNIKNKASKIEGSFTNDNISSVANELAYLMDTKVDTIIDDVMLDTAEGDNLDRKAIDFYMKRNQGKPAVGIINIKGDTGAVIYEGTELISNTGLVFVTVGDTIIDAEGNATGFIKCVDLGEKGNLPEGSITEFKDDLNGVETVFNDELSGGWDTEQDEDFRKRILNRVRKPITSGNKNHYIHWAMEITGIKHAKVEDLYAGAGTVKVVVFSKNGRVDQTTLKSVKEHIEVNRPVGASVCVESAVPKEIKIVMDIALGDDVEKNFVKKQFEEKINEYIASLEFNENKPFSYYKIGDIAFKIEGVNDVLDYSINGEKKSIKAEKNEYFRLKEVVINGS